MEFLTSRETFNRSNFLAIALDSEDQARANWLIIEQNRARATNAVLTSQMGSR
jgi:hypothetical protein